MHFDSVNAKQFFAVFPGGSCHSTKVRESCCEFLNGDACNRLRFLCQGKALSGFDGLLHTTAKVAFGRTASRVFIDQLNAVFLDQIVNIPVDCLIDRWLAQANGRQNLHG